MPDKPLEPPSPQGSPPRTNPAPEKKKMEGLFESFPHGTLAFLATGSGVMAVFTLLLEQATGKWLAQAAGWPFSFVSVPMGVATMILAWLVSRSRPKYAIPAIVFGAIYWVLFAIWG